MMDAFTAVAMYVGLVLGQVGRLRGDLMVARSSSQGAEEQH